MKTKLLFLLFFTAVSASFAQNWISTGIGGGGAFFSPSINPHNPQDVYVVSDMSGVYHTSNFGQNWNMLNYKSLEAFTESKLQFTSNPNVMYCINDVDREFRRETYKSIDGGETWNALGTDPTNGETFYLFADDQNENRLILSSYYEIYFSNDGGNSFSQIYVNNTGNDDAAHIAGVFWDGNSIFVGTSRGILASLDNGSTFNFLSLTGIPNNQGIASFAGAKENNTIRFFCVVLNRTDIWPSMFGDSFYGFKGMYKLDYNTSTQWISTFNQPQNIRPFYVAMARNDIDIIYAAGGDSAIGFPIIYKSTDGGSNWQDVFLTNNNQNIVTGWSGWDGDYNWWWGGNAFGFTVSQNNPDYAVITDLGYVHGTTDGGQTWHQMYVSPNDENPINNPTPKRKAYLGIGLEDTSCWWIHWLNETNIFAGFADITAIKTTDGGIKWSKDYYNFDYNSVYQFLNNPLNTKLFAATSSVHDIYESHRLTDNTLDAGTGEVMYSTDSGLNWQTLHDFNHPVVWISLNPNNENTMYASVVHSTQGGIFVSHNIQNGASSTWNKLNNPPRTEGHPQNVFVLNDGTLICSYSGRINNSGSFTSSSGIFVSTNGGSSWEDRTHSDMIYWVRDLYIDPFDSSQNTWYVSVFSGWGGAPNNLGGLFKTTNRGVSWERLNSNYRVATSIKNPNNSNQLFFTTESEGLWKSDNINDPIPTFQEVESYPFKHPHRVFFNPFDQQEIWVASFGGGIHYADFVTANDDMEILLNYNKLDQNYPNPFNSSTKINWQSPVGRHQTLKVFDVLGNEIATLVDEYKPAGSYEVEFNAKELSSGVYFYQLKAGEFVQTKKMILLR